MSARECDSRRGAGLEEESGPRATPGEAQKEKGGRGRSDCPGLDPTRTDLERGGVGQGRTGLVGTAGSARMGLTQRVDGNDPIPSFTTPRRHPHSPAGSEPAQPPPPLPPPWFPVPLLPVTELQRPDFALHPAAPLHWWRGPFPPANHSPELLTPPPMPGFGHRRLVRSESALAPSPTSANSVGGGREDAPHLGAPHSARREDAP